MDSSIRVVSRIDPRDPILVAAWPGMGNVAYGAAMYLKENLKASKCAEILPNDVFYKTGVQIRDGLVEILIARGLLERSYDGGFHGDLLGSKPIHARPSNVVRMTIE